MDATDSVRPRVILSIGNISHYYHMALALQRAGYLKRLICSVGYSDNALYKLLPRIWQSKLRRRYYPEIEPSLIQNIPWSELFPRALKAMGAISFEKAYWFFSHVYDWNAQRYAIACEFFHYVVPNGLYSGRRAKKQGGKLIADVRSAHIEHHDNLVMEENELWGFNLKPHDALKEKTLAEYCLADYLIVPSQYVKDTFCKRGFDENKIYVVPYGVDLARFAPQEKQIQTDSQRTNQPFRVIFVGQIVPGKGVHYLLDVFSRLKLPNSELILAGPVDPTMHSRVFKGACRNLRIKLLGYVPNAELIHYYSCASVFVIPSVDDAFSLVTLEAMACGLPVIVTENNGSKEVVREGVDGYIVPIRDMEALAGKLTWLYEHPAQREEMGRQARERATEFTWENYGKRIVQLYNQLCHRINA